jgi:hypothetical protein
LQLTYADFVIANSAASLPNYIDANLLDKAPKLVELRKRVEGLSGVKEWIAKRDTRG